MLGLSLVRIDGNSMAPRLRHGAFALFRRSRRLAVRDVVLVDHARFGRIVKQIESLDRHSVMLSGLGHTSVSAAQLGRTPRRAVRGKLLARVSAGR